MNNFEPSSVAEMKERFDTLRTKSLADVIALFGKPHRELGRHELDRVTWEGKSEKVAYRRSVAFLGTGTSPHILWVHERLDGCLEFHFDLNLDADPYEG